MSVEKPIAKEPLQQITAGVNSAIDQSEFIAVSCNLFKARESSRVRLVLGFAHRRLKNWRTTKPSDTDGGIITCDSHLKTTVTRGSFHF